jgi:hypothetical protein
MNKELPKLTLNQRATLRELADSLDCGGRPQVRYNPRGKSLEKLGILEKCNSRNGRAWGITALGIDVLDLIGREE